MRRSGPDFWRKVDGVKVSPYAFMHPCCVEGCENEGSLGIGVNLRKKEPGRWYCRAHWPKT